jgi:hypothetical protein
MTTGPEPFANWLNGTRQDHREVLVQLHELLMSVNPAFSVAVKWAKPSYAVDGNLLMYLADQARYVQLGFYNGAQFEDPHGLIEGTGKRLRHIKVAAEGYDAATEQKLRDTIAASIRAGSDYAG